MGQIANALGLGAKFTYKDKDYTLSPWSYKIQGSFEIYLADHAKKIMKEMKAYLTDAEYRDLVKDTHAEITGGAFSFGQQLVVDAMSCPTHMEYLLYLCLKPNHPDMTPLLAKEIVAEQMAEILEKMAEANSDPNSKGPKSQETNIPPSDNENSASNGSSTPS